MTRNYAQHFQREHEQDSGAGNCRYQSDPADPAVRYCLTHDPDLGLYGGEECARQGNARRLPGSGDDTSGDRPPTTPPTTHGAALADTPSCGRTAHPDQNRLGGHQESGRAGVPVGVAMQGGDPGLGHGRALRG
jgi:hypothetical protein